AGRPVKNLLVPRPADRWTAAQKADLVLQVLRGDTTRTDACRAHALEPSELDGWVERFLAAGMGALGQAVDATPSTHELRTILDKIPTLVWRSDADGSAELFNRRWLEDTGMSADQASGGGWASPAPSGSELRTGRAEVDERPDLDGAQRGEGDTRSDPHRLAEIARLDHDHAAERLLGLHERTVGRRYLAVADLHGRGRRRELESDGRHQVTAGLQLAVVGPDGAENRL